MQESHADTIPCMAVPTWQHAMWAFQCCTTHMHHYALKEAFDHPERVDDLFLERGVINVSERLGLMAGLDALDGIFAPGEEAVISLIEQALRGATLTIWTGRAAT